MVKLNVERPVQLCRQTSQNVHNSTKKRITCRDNLTRACLSIITKQTRALPLLAVCTLCVCTLFKCTLCMCTLCLCTLHSPRIPSRVVVSLSIGHAHCTLHSDEHLTTHEPIVQNIHIWDFTRNPWLWMERDSNDIDIVYSTIYTSRRYLVLTQLASDLLILPRSTLQK